MDERMRFIVAVNEDPKGNFRRLCDSFGISRAKGYKWVQRYREQGPGGLEDRKPIARSCPHRTPEAMVDRVVALRKDHPFDGPEKLRARLEALGNQGWKPPAASTIGEILYRHGLIRPRRARLRVPANPNPLGPCEEPNDVWCVDFKGHFACGDGRRCHPLTVSDGASRYLIKCEALDEPKHEPVQMHFERAFREFGLPTRIRSDNGAPFATKAIGGLSKLSVWWVKLGILPERIEPGKPQQNGRHERMHRTLKEQTASPPHASMADQQRAFDRFRHDYNRTDRTKLSARRLLRGTTSRRCASCRSDHASPSTTTSWSSVASKKAAPCRGKASYCVSESSWADSPWSPTSRRRRVGAVLRASAHRRAARAGRQSAHRAAPHAARRAPGRSRTVTRSSR